MNCGLCKKPIRGDESYVTDHYKCSADFHQELLADVAKAEAQRDELLAELRNIATADPSTWDADVRDQFRPWAQNRALSAMDRLDKAGQK
jgi:hypothetical protein